MGLKDKYLKTHSEHVSYYAVLLGKELKLSSFQLSLLKVGGLLHDIGKIGIPDSILKKETILNDEEYEIIKKHPLIGDTIISNLNCEEIKQMVRSHHERIDGFGYPDGLKGDDISYFTRIISIADCFDAMTTKRTYNRIKTLDEAFLELRRSSTPMVDSNGLITQQLDSKLVEVFIEAIIKNDSLMEIFRKRDMEIIKLRETENKIRTFLEKNK